jgi:HD domain
VKLNDIDLPRTSACQGALDAATHFYSPSLLHHCIRSYIWAAAYAADHDMGHDAELLYVAALLHDLGLVAEFDSHTVAFEDVGGHLAWLFTTGAGWPTARRDRAAEVVVRHMWDAVDPAADPEGFLLEMATGVDISGRHARDFPAALRSEVLATYPRLNLATEFTACLAEQARRKPETRAGQLWQSGAGDRIAHNPLDEPVQTDDPPAAN